VGGDARRASVLTFEREAGRAPVGFAGDVVVDRVERDAREPRRGSCREVSLGVVAIDDHRAVPNELLGAGGVQFLEWHVDRTRYVLTGVTGCRKYLDQLRGLPFEQALNFVSIDRYDHPPPPTDTTDDHPQPRFSMHLRAAFLSRSQTPCWSALASRERAVFLDCDMRDREWDASLSCLAAAFLQPARLIVRGG
jgi:hypothetical protein